MKTPLSPSQLLESGQIFAFGGICHELVETPAPTTSGLCVQQTPSAGLTCSSSRFPFLRVHPVVVFHCLTPSCCLVPGQSGAYSLCDVCNLQLTSAAQAQLHYNGRSHLRRVRQLQPGEVPQQRAGMFTRLLNTVGQGDAGQAQLWCLHHSV